LTPNKKQTNNTFISFSYLICLFLSPIFLLSHELFAQESYKLNELEINRVNDLEEDDNFGFPTNPFEIVDKIRRANGMNDATKPSDAIDDAIKSFDMIKEDKQI
tara:strand:- start:2900 stop:3211 length:312 start_codon:yes stop_codon:yes gene_type:complete